MRTQYFIQWMAIVPLSLVACSSTVHRVELPVGSDPRPVLIETETRLMNDRSKQYDQMSPRHFKSAETALTDARRKWEKGESSEKVLNDVGQAMAELQCVEENGHKGSVVLKSVLSAREAAKNVKADVTLPKQFNVADERLKSFGSDIEANGFRPESAKILELEVRYSDLELLSIQNNSLGEAQFLLEKSRRDDAQKKASETYRLAQVQYDSAMRLIEVNRHDPEVYAKSVAQALQSAQKLDQVMTTINVSKTTEAVAVQLYDQQQRLAMSVHNIQELRGENRQYADREELSRRIEKIKSTFSSNEAEVVRDGKKIVIRLKNRMFESARFDLTASSLDTLQKVKKMIAAVPVSRVIVEGHTDGIGTVAVNKKLSQNRAEAIMQYFIAEQVLVADQVEAKGLGYDRPLTTNKTKKGRAMNRRVDIVIETTATM